LFKLYFFTFSLDKYNDIVPLGIAELKTLFTNKGLFAIGNKIADYLIKPVNPNQILLSLKKNLDHSRLISEKTTSNYQQEFRKIAMDLSMVNSYEEWVSLYQKLIYWEIQLEDIEDAGMFEILESQKNEANLQFGNQRY